MAQERSKILTKMLDRLFAAMANGPSLNCKPHSSRQRVDLIQFARLGDITPNQVLHDLLGEARSAKIVARISPPKKKAEPPLAPPPPAHPEVVDPATVEEKAAQQAWSEQQGLISKLRTIAEESRTYENDTGVHVLHVGFPLLSLPPGSFGLQRSFTRRILAPLAFMSVSLTLRGGATPAILLECKGDGDERIVPNSALLAWLEQQTGHAAAEAASEEVEKSPWEHICAIVRQVSSLLEIPVPPGYAEQTPPADPPALQAAPRSEDQNAGAAILSSAILGLFPMSNQGLLRDMQAMVAGESVGGPVESFLNVGVNLIAPAPPAAEEAHSAPMIPSPRQFAEERLVSRADPCQSRAVKLARTSRGLVIHGPPGTGKSQTITNIIGDHLSRGQRVLLVCDKRTALDVVMNRLDSLGLGQLCAVVHDAQRDQRELYKEIREQLDGLPDVQTRARANNALAKVDAELQKLHQDLSAYHAALMSDKTGQGVSFHELMGQWLHLPSFDVDFPDSAAAGVGPDDLEKHAHETGDLLQRAAASAYPKNPWVEAAGLSLADFLATPMEQLRQTMHVCQSAAADADSTLDPSIPPFAPGVDLLVQGQKRLHLAERLREVLSKVDASILSRWAPAEIRAIRQERQKLRDVAPLVESLDAGPLDTELSLSIRSRPPILAMIGQESAALDEYLMIAGRWTGIFAFGKKSAARKVLNGYGLPFSPQNASRLKAFLSGLRARLVLQVLHEELLHEPASPALPADDAMNASLKSHILLFDLLIHVAEEPALADLMPLIVRALSNSAHSEALLHGLAKSPARAEAIAKLEASLQAAKLFAATWLAGMKASLRQGRAAVEAVAQLAGQLPALENVLRVREGLAAMPPALRPAVDTLVQQSIGADEGLIILKKAVLSQQIIQRLKSDPTLQNADGQKLRSSFERYRALDDQKKSLVRDTILHLWIGRQKQRLLAATGSRLNGQGADLRRRLTLRGQRAMRLRQVIAVGQETDGGDPLFDMRPVWMASPETVAQIFPRQSLFDVVIFDEASQCRLEEALPVMSRAQRLVVAGDPRQLPPTRFFESALTVSEDDEIENDQQLFEAQQGEIEDLLAAALNIEIQECYLDVHYRSRNSDLIEFSNQHFYNARLQAIPGHPSNRSRFAPLTLYACHGLYEKRSNPAEADQVCKIVQDLLRRAQPPSIGIACFNLQQRDLIVDKLESLSAADAEFSRRFADARNRRGAASFEGLFVKNLESVQGDERDHIIISTTFGPDAKGHFYRRFGPLGRAGGGRRLNVLVTRAREEVHLVTSIPQSVYRALPPIPPGETPGGGWLLFSYLAYAEQLAQTYEMNHRLLAEMEPAQQAAVNVLPSKSPSRFSEALARRLAVQDHVGSDVHWGNDGFCVDLAMHHPRRAQDVTIGVICDLTRFAQAEDPVEWEMFRTAVLESQGWQLHRLWTPHFFRDSQGCTDAILKDIAQVLATEVEKDALPVVETPEETGEHPHDANQ